MFFTNFYIYTSHEGTSSNNKNFYNNESKEYIKSELDDANSTFSKACNKFFYLKSFIEAAAWAKLRTIYYISNWVYTTNHKRIAVNYFWFVILSGIVGMVLATVIRLEFAYPGVGIFAGDSLQYLSLVTAHGVIMVFFMIMPLLFGAFANFLLPTQLGVHDVAFPRLNSAAFWFLPGGLLMLAQLVCVDRRYQRMNCFNIREIQSILKRRFFVDLVNEHEVNQNLHKSMVGLKYRLNGMRSVDPDLNVFYNFGLSLSGRSRNFFLNGGDFNDAKGWVSWIGSENLFTILNYFSNKAPLFTFFNTLILPLLNLLTNTSNLSFCNTVNAPLTHSALVLFHTSPDSLPALLNRFFLVLLEPWTFYNIAFFLKNMLLALTDLTLSIIWLLGHLNDAIKWLPDHVVIRKATSHDFLLPDVTYWNNQYFAD